VTNYFHPTMDDKAIGAISALGLAHVGDAVYELLIRTWLCTHGKATSRTLHKATVQFVSAPAQAAAIERLLPLLAPEEIAVYRRGRNTRLNTIPKHATHEQYAKATGLEALFGALYLSGKIERINVLFTALMEVTDAV
jgi:ribonuclease-3 family protein